MPRSWRLTVDALRITYYFPAPSPQGILVSVDGSRVGRVFRQQVPGPAVCVAQFLRAKLREAPHSIYFIPFISRYLPAFGKRPSFSRIHISFLALEPPSPPLRHNARSRTPPPFPAPSAETIEPQHRFQRLHGRRAWSNQ